MKLSICRKKTFITIICVMMSSILLFASLSLYASASGSDPLISLSYLTEIFAPQLKREIAAETEAAISSALAALAAADTSSYDTLTLDEGKRIYLSLDSEMIFRAGDAHFVSADPDIGLADLTTGCVIGSGSPLEAGHIYIIQQESDCAYILVTGEKASIMLRGENEIS